MNSDDNPESLHRLFEEIFESLPTEKKIKIKTYESGKRKADKKSQMLFEDIKKLDFQISVIKTMILENRRKLIKLQIYELKHEDTVAEQELHDMIRKLGIQDSNELEKKTGEEIDLLMKSASVSKDVVRKFLPSDEGK